MVLGLIGYYLSSFLDFLGLQYISVGLERLTLFFDAGVRTADVVFVMSTPGHVAGVCCAVDFIPGYGAVA